MQINKKAITIMILSSILILNVNSSDINQEIPRPTFKINSQEIKQDYKIIILGGERTVISPTFTGIKPTKNDLVINIDKEAEPDITGNAFDASLLESLIKKGVKTDNIILEKIGIGLPIAWTNFILEKLSNNSENKADYLAKLSQPKKISKNYILPPKTRKLFRRKRAKPSKIIFWSIKR